jgi:hypothetical protein
MSTGARLSSGSRIPETTPSPAAAPNNAKSTVSVSVLPNQTAAARSDRLADRHFAAPRFCPRQQQIRDVGAGQQQQQPDRPEQH